MDADISLYLEIIMKENNFHNIDVFAFILPRKLRAKARVLLSEKRYFSPFIMG